MKLPVITIACLMLVFGSVATASENAAVKGDATSSSSAGEKSSEPRGSASKTASGITSDSVLPSASPDTKSKILAQPTDVTSSLLQVTLGLFFVLMIIAVAAWFARRFGKFNVTARGNLRIIGGLHMGARERVVLMQVGEQQLLLGVAPGSIKTLHVLDQPIDTDEKTVSPLETPTNAFSAILKKFQS